MIFTELVLENFGVYADRNIIDLRTQNNGVVRPIVLLGGMNGGGKTTLMDAIRLALYGQRAKCSTRGNLGYGNFLIQSINSQASSKDLTKIELSFEHIIDDQWKEFKIVRAWNKQDIDGKDSLSIIVDHDYDDALAKTWDEYVENILPLGISNLFLFDGEQVKELAELETPPQLVVEAIQSLLGLELAEKLAVDLDVLVGRKRKLLATKSQLKTIDEIETRLAQLEKQKQQSRKKSEELQTKLVKAQKKQKLAYNKFRTEGGKIAAESSELQARINDLTSSVEQQREDLLTIAASSLPLLQILSLLENAHAQADTEIKKEQFKQARNIVDSRDKKLLNYLTDLSLESEQIDKIKWFLEQENETINNSIQHGFDAYLATNEDELKPLVNTVENKLPFQQQLAVEKITKLKQLEIEINNIERQCAIAAPPEAYQKLNTALETAQQQLNKSQAEYEAEQYKYEQIDKEIDRSKKELQSYSESAIDSVNDEHIIKSAAKVQKTLELFREKLTLKKLNKLEVEVTECFRYLLHKSNLVHRVAIARDSFGLSLYDPNGQLLPKQRLSAGEKQLLAIAFLWGLARVSGRNLPIAIDTPLGRLDSSHRNHLIERYFPTASHQVILLSTDTEIGKLELAKLRELEAISRSYLLKYHPAQGNTTMEEGYFW
jgi:DNA sulfur modification protein DndD